MDVTFKGEFGTVLGGFPCIRGYASFKDLAEFSEPNPSYQRNLIDEHQEEMKQFLSKGEYLFFPEVILSYTFQTEENFSISQIIENKGRGTSLKIKNNNSSELKLKTTDKLNRIDGNHRLSAYEQNKDAYGDLLFPFCIILFDGDDELKRQNIIFHNINFKQIPLTKEKSLEILFKEAIYSDDDLKSLGVEYVITKKILEKIKEDKDGYEKLPFLSPKTSYEKTFIFEAISFLCSKTSIKSDFATKKDKVLKKILQNLKDISVYYDDLYKNKPASIAMLSCLLYYQYNHTKSLSPKDWFLDNKIYEISDNNLKAESLQILYEAALHARTKDVYSKIRFATVAFLKLFNIKKWFLSLFK